VTVLVAAQSPLEIPVSCVEQGRWSARSARTVDADHISHANLRRREAETLAAQPLALGLAQSEVWDEVSAKASRMAAPSPTGAAADTFHAHRGSLDELEPAFPLEPGQCGAVFALGEIVTNRHVLDGTAGLQVDTWDEHSYGLSSPASAGSATSASCGRAAT
jgi:hypothetical protein